jgi:two-component system, OmpR family, sensor kinase
MRMLPDSVRWRLTMWYSLVLATILGAFAIASFEVLRRVLESRSDRFLEQTRDAFAEELRTERAEEAAPKQAIAAALQDFQFRDVFFVVLDSAYRAVGTSPATAHSDSALHSALDVNALARVVSGDRSRHILMLPDDEGGYRVAVRTVTLDGAPYVLAAAYARHQLREVLELVGAAYVLAIPILLLVSGAGGYFLAGRALLPVATMSRQARAISATNLHERLPVENPRDELGELATMVNGLLARLEGTFEQHRRFMADASHELRTPTAIVRAEAEIALARDSRTEAEYREALRVVQDAGHRLSRIVEDLFLLARADAGHRPPQDEPLYLDELIADVARAMQGLATRRSVHIDLAEMTEAPFTGDAELLSRMLLNLFDNAVKYSSPGTAVGVSLLANDRGYEIRVADKGPGIPADAQDQIFERFFRVSKARSQTEKSATSGAGLGLSIARWIAVVHGGTLELARSTEDGSEFLVVLPRTEPGTDGDRATSETVTGTAPPGVHAPFR